MIIAYQGMVAPNAYVVQIGQGSSGIDLTTVSAATLQVRMPDGTSTTWTATISSQTTPSLVLTHNYVANDLAQAGDYSVYATMTVPAGTIESHPEVLRVRPKFDTEP